MKQLTIELRKMNAEDFAVYVKEALPLYASEKRKGEGLTQAEADRVAEESFKNLLPQGVHTQNQFLFSVFESGGHTSIGTLWFGLKDPESKKAYIYDIIISPEKQGLGFGQQLMVLLENECLKLGIRKIHLHVFGHNQRARVLYEKMGYHITNVMMAKELFERQVFD